jgi:hypothetical protein
MRNAREEHAGVGVLGRRLRQDAGWRVAQQRASGKWTRQKKPFFYLMF